MQKHQYLLIFDLDGVLINSKTNMMLAWNSTKKIHKIKKNFKSYFLNIGMPFEEILKRLHINKDINKISKTYKKESVNHFNKIKLFKNVKKTLNKLRKNNKLAIVTSKDLFRTKKILKKFNLKFDIVCSPKKNLKGKPFPDQINYVIKKLNYDKNKVYYIGDMHVDYKASKNSKIDFIFASYGYGKKLKIYDKKISNIKQIFDFIV
ncbi:HAD family hydrolase [Candidatus Pelagibacter sp.]|uniref:HAD family hydrolase n=1 Tax=Candidatus Pelagibacter sp. TaxID=2024849 RepID=UPI003F85CC53